ncbi:uncharacterized protein K460DRAFT_411769 [Cucurbitaria berberidis CBS 394.84]|uniref:Zn(2)-C6 fungal-type domain-containing protein n=1 Tax=Cucurbitaria berberidis CBS 394.84 TaxID=1168544 RepID=A0A9P4GR39_9PLEO|nr:uncharacterized protein K460DRAFT_411769 [Cucurbitaria berberidis CBS 394.84]KAF1849974.1 hypothetical protein K460DRAFT_411769 [Cucurbitaria berberidis CBS 394.84]
MSGTSPCPDQQNFVNYNAFSTLFTDNYFIGHPSPPTPPVHEPQCKRRKLDLVKCDRCREDKQKCMPANRVYPTKCNRCCAKDLPCSEGKRASRKSKPVPNTQPPTSSPGAAEGTDLEDLEVLFNDWIFLLDYHSNLAMAMERLRGLQREIFQPFLNTALQIIPERRTSERMEILSDFMETCLTPIFLDVANELRETGLHMKHLPAFMFPSLIGSTLLNALPTLSCPVCTLPVPEFAHLVLQQGYPVGRNFLIFQNQLLKHAEVDHSTQAPVDGVQLKDTVFRYVQLNYEVQEKAHDFFSGPEFSSTALPSEGIGLYHPQGVGYQLFLQREEVVDCLGRSPLHFWLDGISCDCDDTELEILQEPMILLNINKSDILSRTPLHIACQHGWEATTHALLDFGADPHKATIYGSLPLHYAAAKGFVVICKLLLAHMDVGVVDSKDCEGNDAARYALDNNHVEVYKLIDIIERLEL